MVCSRATQAEYPAHDTLMTHKQRFLLVQGVTVGRVPLAVVFAAALLLPTQGSGTLWACVALLAFIELSDLLDGILARRLDVVSEWGAMLDPYSDSASRIIIYWALACNGLALAIVPLGMALRDVTVAYARIVLTRHAQSVSSNWLGKAKAWVQGVGAFALLLGPSHWEMTIPVVSWTVFIVTVASVVGYVRAAFSAAQSREPGKAL